MNAILTNETNPALNLAKSDAQQSKISFKIREDNSQNDIPQDEAKNSATHIGKELTNQRLDTLKSQLVEDLKANTGDSKSIKRSWSRGYLHRAWTQGLSMALGHIAGDNKTPYENFSKNFLHTGLTFETAYQGINRSTDARGGSILPSLAKSYETEDGKNKEHAGSLGHIAAKTVDHLGRAAFDAGTAATISQGLSAAISTGAGLKGDFGTKWHDLLTKGSDFNYGGELVNELRYYTGLDLGIHSANALGLNKTWSGALLASTIGAASYTMAESRNQTGSSTGISGLYDGNNPGKLGAKFIGRTIQRLGVMGQIYALPLPFMDSVFKGSNDKAQTNIDTPQIEKTPEQQARDKTLNRTARISEAAFAATSFGLLSALCYFKPSISVNLGKS